MKYIKNLKRMSCRNSKLDSTLIFNLMAGPINQGGTCLNCSDCWSACYAQKAQLQYKAVAPFRKLNTELARNNIELLKHLLMSQIHNTPKLKVVRLHSAGDFISQEYIDMWYKIAHHFKKHLFYAYTKVKYAFDFTKLERLSNVNIINSYLKDPKTLKRYLNYGNRDYIKNLRTKIKDIYVCPATTNKNIKCNLDCKYCHTNDKVVFLQH
jgi:hypothetical protein